MDYMKYVARSSILELRPPAKAIFANTDGLAEGRAIRSVVIDRRGRFQTELFLASEEIKEAAVHIHPGVDSYELFVAGDFLFSLNGAPERCNIKSDGRMIGENVLMNVPEDAPHGAQMESGACFLSFQHWKSKEPTSVGHSFVVVEDEEVKQTTK